MGRDRDKVIDFIKRHKRFLIVSHIGLEGDSIGSQFAFKMLLEQMGKEGVIANEERPSSQYDFLNVKEKIITDLNADIHYDAIAVLDCPVIKRIGKAKALLNESRPLANIDHHISNTNFGDVNWVEPYKSSCGEMIYDLYKELNISIDNGSALFIYIAILTDTGSFAYENTSSATHRIAGELVSKGIKPHSVYQSLYENKTLSEIGLLKDALSTIRMIEDGKVAYMYVSKKMFKKYNLGLEATEDFIKYARAVNSAKVAVIFLEDDSSRKNEVHISFRSKGEIDVDRLAALLGGGGHRNAAGCVLEGGLKAVKRRVLNTVCREI